MVAPVIESGDITTSTGTSDDDSGDFPDYVSGDLLIMFWGMDDDETANSLNAPANGPNGEILILSSVGTGGHSSSGPTQGVVAWVGDATISAGSLAWTWDGSEFWTCRCIKVLAGEFDASTPIGAVSGFSGNTDSGGTVIRQPSWTLGASDGGGTILVHICTDNDAITGTVSGWTLIVNTDHGGVATAISIRDTDSVDSETTSAVEWAISSDSSSTKGLVVRGPVDAGVTKTTGLGALVVDANSRHALLNHIALVPMD